MARWLGSTLRFAGRLLVILGAAAAGVVLAAVVARQGSRAWIPPFTKDEVVPVRKAITIPAIGGSEAIRGTVLATDGRPLSKATVRVSAGYLLLETATDDLGVFSVDKLPSEPITVVAAAAGYRPEIAGPFVPPKKDVTIQLTRVEEVATPAESTRADGSLALVVAIEGNGERAPRLQATAIPDANDGRDFALLPRTVELEGTPPFAARFPRLPAGRWRVLALPRGASADARLAYAEGPAVVEPNQEAKLQLSVRFGSVSGRVTHMGEPVARAFARAYRRTKAQPKDRFMDPTEVELARGVTDSDGKFLLADLPAGDMSLEILSSGFQSWSRPITVAADARPLEVELLKAR